MRPGASASWPPANGALHRDQFIIPRTHADGFGILNLMPAPRIRMQRRELVVAAGVRAVLAQRNEAVRFLHQIETGRARILRDYLEMRLRE